ncbi:hypothetical protein BVY03_00280 [bacterium K02(2017)]|nr:hypothetical protein BVY03_00280 [bacterium K02(2017)]
MSMLKKLNTFIFLGIILGLGLGLLFAFEVIPAEIFSVNLVEFFRFFGRIFMLLLKMIVVPLVFFSIFCGVTSIGDITHFGRIGKRTFTYYISTTFIAVILGLILVNLIKPGLGLSLTSAAIPSAVENAKDMTILSMLTKQIEAFFINPFEALAKGTSSMIAIIFASIFLAYGVLKIKHRAKNQFIDLMNVVNAAVMQITSLVLMVAPVGIMGILIGVLYDRRDRLDDLVQGLSLFVLTAMLGLAIHGGVVLPAILKIFTKFKLGSFYKGIFPALQMAFGTDSSSATMPVTMQCTKDNLKLNPKTVDFVIPIGATINMDGTALYEAVCALFIAQALGMDLSMTQQIIVCFTAVIASIGAAGIPSAGLVTLVIVINAVGINYELALPYIGMIWAVDRFIDMCRTVVNVEGDCIGAAIVAEYEGQDEAQNQKGKDINLGQDPKNDYAPMQRREAS